MFNFKQIWTFSLPNCHSFISFWEFESSIQWGSFPELSLYVRLPENTSLGDQYSDLVALRKIVWNQEPTLSGSYDHLLTQWIDYRQKAAFSEKSVIVNMMTPLSIYWYKYHDYLP